MKALLLHSGRGIRTKVSKVPDVFQGYGLVDLSTSLPLNGSNFDLFLDQRALGEFQQFVYVVVVRSSAVPLKLTLSWFDPPNRDFAAKTLIHDLDLVLINPAGEVVAYGNTIFTDGTPSADMRRDELNNNEQITISSPLPGAYRVLIQSKLLFSSNSQSFAVIVTMDGFVVSPVSSSDILNPGSLLDCPATTSTNGEASVLFLSLEMSLFEMLYGQGWQGNKYRILKDSVVLHTATLENNLFYKMESLCVQPGQYTVELDLSNKVKQESSMVELPTCKVLVAPLIPSQSFEVTSRGDETLCSSSCLSGDHILLDIHLEEPSCDGWSGAYFALHDAEDTSSNNGITGGTLEWGCSLDKELCLPAVTKCYLLQLYKPSSLQDFFPILRFSTAFLRGKQQQESCPYFFAPNVTVGNICINAEESTGHIDFYLSSPKDYTNTLETWNDVIKLKKESSLAGNCLLNFAHTLMVDGHDFSCFQSCEGYPKLDSLSSNVNAVCSFFQTSVFTTCGSYDMARNNCIRPSCASKCSAKDWCYFAASSVSNCMLSSSETSSSAAPWRTGDAATLSAAAMCESSSASADGSGAPPSLSSSPPYLQTLRGTA